MLIRSTPTWSVLLLLLISAFFLEALLGSSRPVEFLSLILFALALLGSNLLTHAEGPGRTIGLVITGLWCAISVATFVGLHFQLTAMALSGLMLTSSLYGTFRYLIKTPRADMEVLLGAVYGYLLLVMAWAFLYLQIERWQPGSFNIPHDADLWSTFLYFSIVTVTTLGYGDVLPISNLARLVAGFEAIIGVLYIAVMIGGIVGSFHRSNRP